MKALLCLTLVLAVFSFSDARKLKKTAGCANPVYVISFYDGKVLDLTPATTCGQTTRLNAIMDKLLSASWCYTQTSTSSGSLVFNGNCAVSFHSDSGIFSGLFAQAMMNTDKLNWFQKKLGNGFSQIISGPSSGNKALSWDGASLSLQTPVTTDLKQLWILLPNQN